MTDKKNTDTVEPEIVEDTVEAPELHTVTEGATGYDQASGAYIN